MCFALVGRAEGIILKEKKTLQIPELCTLQLLWGDPSPSPYTMSVNTGNLRSLLLHMTDINNSCWDGYQLIRKNLKKWCYGGIQ